MSSVRIESNDPYIYIYIKGGRLCYQRLSGKEANRWMEGIGYLNLSIQTYVPDIFEGDPIPENALSDTTVKVSLIVYAMYVCLSGQ